MAVEIKYSKPVDEFNKKLADKIKEYKLVTASQRLIMPLENVYAFYNDKSNPLLITVLPNHDNYKIGYDMEVNDNEKTITLKYIDKKFNYVFLPTEKDFSKVKTFFNKMLVGDHKLHDIRNQKTYSFSSIRAFYVSKCMWIEDNGYYGIYCDIFIGGETKTFAVYKKFVGMHRHQAFYIIDEMDSVDKFILHDHLLRVYPSSKLGIDVYNKQIVLDASSVFLFEDGEFNVWNSAFDNIKKDYLEMVRQKIQNQEQLELNIDKPKNDDDVPF